MIAGLIGITVPERLRRRQWAIEAAGNAPVYTLARAQLEYRDLNGRLPSPDELVKELGTLPDPDGSIAEALRNLDVSGYEPTTVVASASTKSKSLVPRGSAIRTAAASANPTNDRGVSFTSYKWRLPGPDKILNTDDDVILQDGLDHQGFRRAILVIQPNPSQHALSVMSLLTRFRRKKEDPEVARRALLLRAGRIGEATVLGTDLDVEGNAMLSYSLHGRRSGLSGLSASGRRTTTS